MYQRAMVYGQMVLVSSNVCRQDEIISADIASTASVRAVDASLVDQQRLLFFFELQVCSFRFIKMFASWVQVLDEIVRR